MIGRGDMKRKRRGRMRWLALLALLVIGGCTTDGEPSPAELEAQWNAQNVVPQNYKQDLDL